MTDVDRSQVKTAVYRIGPRISVALERGRLKNFTDAMTNQMSISPIDVRSALKDTDLRHLMLSDQSLRFFLHEVTHHASFANYIGNALTGLATSICGRASIGVPPGDRAGLWLAQRDDIVFRFFDLVMEPLVEGLALFAEHDIRWGDSPLASHAMLHLWSLFLSSQATDAAIRAIPAKAGDEGWDAIIQKGRQTHDNWMNDFIMAARTRDYWVKEKALLLRQPLLGRSGPAYLLGYLAIKRAYLVLRNVNPGFVDTDIFLLLMLKYWFSDIQLTELLVELQDVDVLSVQLTIGKLAERVQDMWDELYKEPGKIARKLLVTLEGDREIDPMSPVGLGIGLRTAADSINMFVPRFYKHRLVLRLGMIRVNVLSDKDKRMAVIRDAETNEELLQCPLVEHADTGEFPGSVEIVRTYDGRITALVVLGGSGLLAARNLFSVGWNEPEVTEIFDDLPSLEFVEASTKAYEASPFARRWAEEDFREVDEHIMDQAREFCVSMYLQLALRGADKERRTRCGEILGSAGFSSVFSDRAELNEFALLSLYCGGPGSLLGSVAKQINRPVADLIARLGSFNKRSQEILGMDVFELEGESATAAI